MRKNTQAKLLGRYIVADPQICHGQPTFRGTRIMVWQVIEMLADGMAWETIIEHCHHSITKDAIAEAVKLVEGPARRDRLAGINHRHWRTNVKCEIVD